MANNLDADRPLLTIAALTIDCPDPAANGDFYLAALGGTVSPPRRRLAVPADRHPAPHLP